jgi:integrase
MAGNKTKPERYYYMLPEEFKLFLKAAYSFSRTQGILWDITAGAGLRISEALNLSVESFDFKDNCILVRTLKRKEHPLIPVYVSPSLMFSVKEYIAWKKLKAGSFLFHTTRQVAWKKFKKICELAGLSKLYSPHALRHLHGMVVSELTQGDLVAIAKRLRHAQPMTAWRYVHLQRVLEEKIAKEVDKLRPAQDKT